MVVPCLLLCDSQVTPVVPARHLKVFDSPFDRCARVFAGNLMGNDNKGRHLPFRQNLITPP